MSFLFYDRDRKEEMSLLYLLRFIHKGIKERLRMFQGHPMLSQDSFTQRMLLGKEREGKRTALDLSFARTSELPYFFGHDANNSCHLLNIH